MRLAAGMLPEMEALAKVLEMDQSWQQDAAELRLAMLDIITSISESYIRAGKITLSDITVCRQGRSI